MAFPESRTRGGRRSWRPRWPRQRCSSRASASRHRTRAPPSARTRATRSRSTAVAQHRQLLPGAGRHRCHGQRQRPQHLPEPDQRLSAGHAGRHRQVVRRQPPALLRGPGPARADQRRLGQRSMQYQTEGLKDGLHGRRRQPVLRARSTTTLGGDVPQERLGREGLHRAHDHGGVQGPGRPDDRRRPDPAGPWRPGRLAGHGHVRHPEHAPERLRLPHRPDGGPRAVVRPARQDGLRDLARRRPAVHAGGRAGRTWQDAAKAALVDKTAGMYFLGTFAAEQAAVEDIPDIGFFPWPDAGHRVRRRERHRRADRRLHAQRQPQEPRGRQGLPEVRRHA